ncbi:MAG TPA: pilus assembly protein TadG-related protein [Mycobacteriales bacterium]|nr:pilus assembly protein TadG-related protein [Mycobacteriales bacterium]
MVVPREDDGAVAVLVAGLAVLLFFFGAVAVDVSRLHQERRDVQNGADAAALALAQTCGAGGCDSDDQSTMQTLAQQYADTNARDFDAAATGDARGGSNIEEICGEGAAGLVACSWLPFDPPGNGYVMVRTRTGTATSAGVVPPVLARLFAGDGWDTGSSGEAPLGQRRTYAIAAWGAPAGVTAQLPLTFSQCELNALTGADVGDPVYADPQALDPALERVIYFHDTVQAGTCTAGPSGADLPGGFGWLESDGCQAVVEDGWYGDKTGAAIPNDCKKSNPDCKFGENGEPVANCLEKYVGQVVRIPIYDITNGLTGTNGEYHLADYAAFYLTGYRFPSSSYASPDLGVPCASKQTCLSGYFVEDTAGGGKVTDGPSWGLTVYQLVG